MNLYDADTNSLITEANSEQAQASYASDPTGVILIDLDGNVIADGTWESQQPGVRKVYVS